MYGISFLFLAMLVLTSCQPTRPCEDEVICQQYVHRYGVPLDPSDWSSRGKHGQVVATRKDGVVVSTNYNAGVLQGDCTYTFPHRDVIEKKEVYDQGTLVEDWNYYGDGSPKTRVVHNAGSDSVTGWYLHGIPQFREECEGGLLRQGQYFNLANHVESQVDNFQGIRSIRDENGDLEFTDTIVDGVMVTRTSYHCNGAPSAVIPYCNGVVEGEKRTYKQSGEPAAIETWSRGEQTGVTHVFEHGEKVSEVPYVRGVKQGIEKRYRDGSTLVQEISWVNNCKQGPCYSYVGNVRTVDWYFNNQLVNKAKYDALCNQ